MTQDTLFHSNPSIVAVLVKAKERVAQGWCQGSFACWPSGGERIEDSEHPSRAFDGAHVCAIGAILAVTDDEFARSVAAACLTAVLNDAPPHIDVATWNDKDETSLADVLDVYEDAIQYAKRWHS